MGHYKGFASLKANRRGILSLHDYSLFRHQNQASPSHCKTFSWFRISLARLISVCLPPLSALPSFLECG